MRHNYPIVAVIVDIAALAACDAVASAPAAAAATIALLQMWRVVKENRVITY